MRDRPVLRRFARVLWDCWSWCIATLVVVGARYDFSLSDVLWSAVAMYAVAACLLQFLVGTLLMIYRGRYRSASFDESLGLALTIFVVASVLAVLFLGFVDTGRFPRAIAVLTPPVALLWMATARWLHRALGLRSHDREDAERVLIYGAGDAGYQLIRLLTSDPSAPYLPVGMIDDARNKRHLRLHGVPMLGNRYPSLKTGEKKHGVLLGENDFRPAHPPISHVRFPPITQADLASLSLVPGNDLVIKTLRKNSEYMQGDSCRLGSRP